MTTKAELKALTRYQAEVSRVAWERALGLYNEATSELKELAKDGPIPKLKLLTDTVRESDTENIDHLWTMMEIINSMSDMKSAYEEKIEYVVSLIKRLKDEVLKTPTPLSHDDEDEAKSRQYIVTECQKTMETTKEVYIK